MADQPSDSPPTKQSRTEPSDQRPEPPDLLRPSDSPEFIAELIAIANQLRAGTRFTPTTRTTSDDLAAQQSRSNAASENAASAKRGSTTASSFLTSNEQQWPGDSQAIQLFRRTVHSMPNKNRKIAWLQLSMPMRRFYWTSSDHQVKNLLRQAVPAQEKGYMDDNYGEEEEFDESAMVGIDESDFPTGNRVIAPTAPSQPSSSIRNPAPAGRNNNKHHHGGQRVNYNNRNGRGQAGPQSDNPTSIRTVIIDQIHPSFATQLSVEEELFRVAPHVIVTSLLHFPRGGLKLVCKSPDDANKLLSRDGWPDNAFGRSAHVHRPNQLDASIPAPTRPSRHDMDARSIKTSGFARGISNVQIHDLLRVHVDEVRSLPDNDPHRPIQRVLVLKTRELAEQVASGSGLKFLNRIVRGTLMTPGPSPIYCRSCALFGHAPTSCSNDPKCGRCSGNHYEADCDLESGQPFKCPNCGDAHHALFHRCPNYIDALQSETARQVDRAKAKANRAIEIATRSSGRPAFVNSGQTFAGAVAPPQSLPSAQSAPVLAATATTPQLDTDAIVQAITQSMERMLQPLIQSISQLIAEIRNVR